MSALLALLRKQFVETRWFLGLSALALFFMSWLFVYATYRFERNMKKNSDPMAAMRRQALARAIGGPSADSSSTSFEVMFWKHPFVILILVIWPIARGSAAVAGELERGMMDLVLSRPVSRAGYLSAQVVAALLGIAVLCAALILGNQVGNRFNVIAEPPGVRVLLRPVASAAALSFVVYGYTLLFSTLDSVRWRVNLVSSVLTLGGYIAQVVANIPSLDNWKWLEHVSIYTAYDPVEAALKAQNLLFNAGLLGSIGAGCAAIGYLVFSVRDLPTSG